MAKKVIFSGTVGDIKRIGKDHGMFELDFVDDKYIKKAIKKCEGKHVQQVAYSTYHDSFTQICFGCQKIRTSMPKKDVNVLEGEND